MDKILVTAAVVIAISNIIGLFLVFNAMDEARNEKARCVERYALAEGHPVPYGENAWRTFAPLCE